MTERLYQVFVSSTFKDLKTEREEVMRALLELDCFPAGMELFPAADETQWELIQNIIDRCDYYVVIVGGRYGSLTEKGISYTEKEYQYALQKGIPILGFLHGAPDKLPVEDSELKPAVRKKLAKFRKLVEAKPCKYWTNAAELGAVVSRGLTQQIRKTPGVGWIRADKASTSEETALLRAEISDLRLKLSLQAEENNDTAELSAGGEQYVFGYSVQFQSDKNIFDADETVIATWDEIFSNVAPRLLFSLPDQALRNYVNEWIAADMTDVLEKEMPEYSNFHDFKIFQNDYQAFIVQMLALGLIKQSKERLNGLPCWILTTKGEQHMIRLNAVKKKEAAEIVESAFRKLSEENGESANPDCEAG